jgi:hypothetical protein
MFRLRESVRSKGRYYADMADVLEGLPESCGGPVLGRAVRALNGTLLAARKHRLTRSQHVMFLLADMMTWCEVGDALCRKAAQGDAGLRSVEFIQAASRLFAQEALEVVHREGLRIARGCGDVVPDAVESLKDLNPEQAVEGYLESMDRIAQELVA